MIGAEGGTTGSPLLAAVGRRTRRHASAEGGQTDPVQASRRGFWPCLAYLFIEFSRPMAWFSPLALARPGMLVAIWAFAATLFRGLRRPIPKPLMLMFGFIALMAFQVPFAKNNAWAFWGFQDFAILVLGGVMPLAMLPSTLNDVRYLATAYVLLHVPSAVHGLMFMGRGLDGWMGDENDLAFALNAAIGIGVYLLNEAKTARWRILLAAAVAVMVAGVVATMSRGGFVGLAVLGVYMLVAGPKRGRILLASIVAVACLWAFAPPDYWKEVRSIETASQDGDTGAARIYYWKLAWRMFLDHPLVGVGTRNYGIRAPEYEDWVRAEYGGEHVWGRACHSLYFTLIPEQGLVGVALFTALIAWCFRAIHRLRRQAKVNPEDRSCVSAALVGSGLMAGVVASLVTGVFLSVLYYPVLWVLVGLMAALDAIRAQETAKATTELPDQGPERDAPTLRGGADRRRDGEVGKKA